MLNNKNTKTTASTAADVPQCADVETELIRIVYQQSYTALIGVIATATGIAVVFVNEVSAQVVSAWLITIYVLSFIRYLSIKKFKAQDGLAETVIHWGRLFAFFAFLSGLTWGAASIIFFTPDKIELFNILALIIIAMSVGSLAALSAYPKAFYLFVVPAMLPMIWRYLSVDESYYTIFGSLLFVFNLALLSIVRVNNRMIHDSIILRFENIDLIEQLTEQKEKAELANISKTKFLASASHDMRQPIHAMGLFLGVLEERVEKEDQKIIVQKIQKSSDALGSLLDSLLDISKLDAGVIKVVPETFLLNSLFDALNNEFQAVAKEKNLQIKFVSTKLCVNSDYHIIERITRNLISNAIRYTESGRILVACRRYQGQTLIAVYDTGIGIPENKIQAVFREFYQLHNPERDRSKGLGLGLAIVERMAKLLGMPLYIKSLVGKGSVFGFVLPAVQASIPAITKVVAAPDILYFDGKMVLVVDDEEEISDSLTELLRSWHCDVIAAASANEAVQALRKNKKRPDVMLVDYRLCDNETGMMAIDRINLLYAGRESGKTIPAVIITGDTAPDRIKEAERSGYRILHKPVAPDVLRLLLAKVLV